MSEKKENIHSEEEKEDKLENGQQTEAQEQDGVKDSCEDEGEPELTEVEKLAKDLENAKSELEKQKKEYLFLLAEFDNFRKRTLKEKSEIIKNAGEKAMLDILPVVDDFERALQAMHDSSDLESVKEGVDLIYNKFVKYLESNGVKAIDSNNADFNTEFHEAVTTFPAADESQKGKVIDTVQKGYMINDKVLRHSKVVVGQ